MGARALLPVGPLRALGHRYPLCRGQFWLGRNFPEPTADGGAIEAGLRNGPRIWVYPNELIGRAVFYFGDLDPRITWVCQKVLGPGDTVVDVGANYGVIGLVAADLVGPDGLVHAFEPQPALAALLRQSALRNGFKQLHVHEVGLSEFDDVVEMHVPAGHFGGASLNRLSGPGAPLTVEVRHAGRALAELDLPLIRLLKVDIEGHEAAFFRGGHHLFRSSPPEVILFELNDAAYETTTHISFWDREVVLELSDLGYVLVRISQRLGAVAPKLVRMRPGHDRGLDFVAVHRTKYAEIARILPIF